MLKQDVPFLRMAAWAFVTFVVTVSLLMQLGTSRHGNYEYFGDSPLTYLGPTMLAFFAPLVLDWWRKRPRDWFPRDRWSCVAIAVVAAAMVLILRIEGRRWRCACGDLSPWSGDVWSSHNSQHLFDPYSFTHALHGVVFCGLLSWGCPRVLPAWRLCLAVALEGLWEILENSNLIIQRYREATISLDYLGDSVINSVGDLISCGLGFVLARRLGLRRSVIVFLLTEAMLLLWIKDDLFLNVVMLIHPLEAIKAWQMGH